MRSNFQFPISNFQTVILGLVLLISTAVFVLPVAKVHAVDVLDPVCKNADPNNLPQVCKDNQTNSLTNPILDILGTAANLLSLVGGVIAVIVIIIGGLKLIVSGGDSNSVASARRTVMYAILSVLIIAMAQLIVRYILVRLIGG